MADSFIQVPPDSTGSKLDTESLTVGANTVHRERMQIAGTGATHIAPVSPTAGLKVDLGADNDVVISDGGGSITVDGSVTVVDGGSTISVDDGGGTLTVDGTVTANLSATDNAVLDAIQAAVELIDNAIAGSEMQVDVVAALPAGTNVLGTVLNDVHNVRDTVAGGNAEVKFASISAASSGDNTIVAAVASKRIRVLSYVLVADGAVTAQWQSATAGNLSGAMSLAANGGVSAPHNPHGWIEGGVNEDLQLNLGGAVGVRGHLTYVEVS